MSSYKETEVCQLWPENMVLWRSKRGLLEMDILLMGFTKEVYPSLCVDAKRAYQQLLLQNDPCLQSILLYGYRSVMMSKDVLDIVDCILKHQQDSLDNRITS